jgi:hypothetical protein
LHTHFFKLKRNIMKIKPGGKIAIIVILLAVAYFGIRKYQASHPSIPKIDSTTTTIDTLHSIAPPQTTANKPVTVDSPHTMIHEQLPAVAHKKQHPAKKKDGERENLKLDNY